MKDRDIALVVARAAALTAQLPRLAARAKRLDVLRADLAELVLDGPRVCHILSTAPPALARTAALEFIERVARAAGVIENEARAFSTAVKSTAAEISQVRACAGFGLSAEALELTSTIAACESETANALANVKSGILAARGLVGALSFPSPHRAGVDETGGGALPS
ncbi:MAG: hypothetical protein ABMA13_12355 [Chthoniobacteraceae bacterium]